MRKPLSFIAPIEFLAEIKSETLISRGAAFYEVLAEFEVDWCADNFNRNYVDKHTAIDPLTTELTAPN